MIAAVVSALAVVGVVAYLARVAIARADQVGAATAATYEARLALERARADGLALQLAQETARANHLDDLLAQLDAANLDPGGARERVLRLWSSLRSGAPDHAATGAVSAPSATAAADRDGLIRPGD